MGLLGSALTFPTEWLCMCLVRVLVYLVRTKHLGIQYSAHVPDAYKLCARADSNWSERRSTTGFVIFLAGAGINMASRRQHCITMSSCEALFVALADLAIELIHTDAMLEHVGFRREGPIAAGTDNKGAYDLCHRFTSAQNSRHVDRKLFKMREMRGAGIVMVELVPTEINPADIFTKILSRQVFEKHRKKVLNIPDVTPTADTPTVHSTEHVAGSRGGSVAQTVPCASCAVGRVATCPCVSPHRVPPSFVLQSLLLRLHSTAVLRSGAVPGVSLTYRFKAVRLGYASVVAQLPATDGDATLTHRRPDV
eukprot:6734494-Prymnesium_polylepis.1